MSEFIFEDREEDFNVTGTCQVFEQGVVDPTTLIKTNENWFVRIRLQTEGLLNGSVSGAFRLRLRLEGLGAVAPELDLPAADEIVALTPQAAPANYLKDININAGDVPAGIYKLVTTAIVEGPAPNNVPQPIAGYCEGPILQFYNV
jgi:hypothetical protein